MCVSDNEEDRMLSVSGSSGILPLGVEMIRKATQRARKGGGLKCGRERRDRK